jgi:precorrin-4/cobalt-precorrin-4 C11-methyltransferase
MNPATTGTVWFVGAGPGDPELITVKGRRLLEQAGAVLFAGSLGPVNTISGHQRRARS